MQSATDSNAGDHCSHHESAHISGRSFKARPKSAYAKRHNIVQKDFYRVMKTDNFVNKQFEKKKHQDIGRCPPKTLIDVSQNRFKDIGEVISD